MHLLSVVLLFWSTLSSSICIMYRLRLLYTCFPLHLFLAPYIYTSVALHARSTDSTFIGPERGRRNLRIHRRKRDRQTDREETRRRHGGGQHEATVMRKKTVSNMQMRGSAAAVLTLLLILGGVGDAHASGGGAPEPAPEESEAPKYLFHMTAGNAT